jgi:hypothetical protein
MKTSLALTILAVFAHPVPAIAASAPAIPLDSLDPQKWHEPTRVRTPRAKTLHDELRQALVAEDAARIAIAVSDLRRELGPDVSMPEVATDYAGPPDATPRPADEFLKLWLDDCQRRAGREPWDAAAAALRAGRAPIRLRDSQRMAEAYLATAKLLGPEAGAPYRERALAGLRFIRSCQAKSGVFGYPYNPKRTDRLGQQAAALVERGQKQGFTMVEGVWIIDDLGSGDLQFDNGVCGLAMFKAHALTGEKEFLDSAVRAAEWALKRPLVPNWNYNSFSARLLARAFLVTKENQFLEGARRKFELGVLPGQTETGRWFDPHNARTQYHAILATATFDYMELLTAIKAPDLPAAKQAATRALNNLAAQTIAFGASNPHEMLSLEAFQRGSDILGLQSDWDRATRITLNLLATDLRAKIVSGTGHLPETTPLGVLLLRTASR